MKVLLAVDGSIHALHACKYLAAFPLPEPLQVEILTVVNPPEVVMSAQSELWYPQFVEHQEQVAKHALSSGERAVRDLDAEITTHQMMGHVGHCIVERATEGKFDLVVVAAKGHSALERVLLGSVSDYVATHAPCTALVVRQEIPEDRGLDDEIPPIHIRRGMIAVDERGVSEAMLNEVCRYPWTDEHQLTTVTASVKLEVFREDILASTMEEAARRRTEARRCADAAAARLSQCGARASGHSVEVEHVGYGLTQYAEEQGHDFVVVGDSGRGLISRVLLCSTSRYVLHHVHCSVLIVRQGAEKDS